MILPAYASRNISLAWGDITFDGLGPDFFSVTPNAPVSTTIVGADGSRAPSMHPDWTCVLSTTLQQTSPTNRKLAWILGEQRANRRMFVMNFTVSDPSGSTFTLFKDAYLQDGPEQGFASEVGERVWTWNAELNYDYLASGIEFTSSVAGLIEAEVNAAISLSLSF